MKKSNRTEPKAEESIFVKITKIVKSFSRIQILAALTVFAGLILAILLLRSDEATPLDSPAPVTNMSTQQRSENPPVNVVEDVVIKGANRPPVVNAVMLSPNVVLPGISVRVEVKATDPDQDDLRFEFTWKINGQVVADQSGEEFDTTKLRKGELITVTVIPDDGTEKGNPLESNGIIIQNRPPEITSLPSAGVTSGVFQYQVVAQDPDNEPLQFSLEGAPEGMVIDSVGLVHWDVPRGVQGKQQVRVIVSDGSASSFQSFNLNLSEGAGQ